jgi:CRISPR-associated protein Csc2
MAAIDKLFDFIPAEHFVAKKNGSYNLRENTLGHLKIALVRETTNPIIIRSTDSEATITFASVDGRDLVEIPPRKLKSREKLLGLMICREFAVVRDEVRYNSIFDSDFLANPNSVLFGDSTTQSADARALSSRAIYDWAYSLRDVKDITDKLQHNTMGEDGTILKNKDVKPDGDGGVAPQALHSTEYVVPGVLFPHFITVDNISPELFVHLLSCILNQHRYGAQTTTNANNMNNHLVAIGFADFEKPITSYTVSKAWNADKKESPQTLETVKTFVSNQMTTHYTNGLVSNIDGLIKWINELWQDKETLKEIYAQAAKDSDAYLKSIKMISAQPQSPSKVGKQVKGKQTENPSTTEADNDETLPDIG